MLIVISPAKSLDFETAPSTTEFTQPDFLSDAEYLTAKLRKMSARKLGKMMHISPALAQLNQERYQTWATPFSPDNAKQAALAFRGEVYLGLKAETMSEADYAYAQDHLRILSGLYGLLRPLDLIQPYRLEMGTSWAVTPKKKGLYAYWDKRLALAINEQLAAQGDDVLVNLASNEYYKAVAQKHLKARVITPAFLDRAPSGDYKAIMTFAKRARGMMSAYIITNRIEDPDLLKGFDTDGYKYAADRSTPEQPVFMRG